MRQITRNSFRCHSFTDRRQANSRNNKNWKSHIWSDMKNWPQFKNSLLFQPDHQQPFHKTVKTYPTNTQLVWQPRRDDEDHHVLVADRCSVMLWSLFSCFQWLHFLFGSLNISKLFPGHTSKNQNDYFDGSFITLKFEWSTLLHMMSLLRLKTSSYNIITQKHSESINQ